MSRKGKYIISTTSGEKVKAYCPPSLPFSPAIDTSNVKALEDKANQLLGKLDAATSLMPNTGLLIYFYVRKEALLSSQIEGTQSSFADLLYFENEATPGVPIDDVEEVSHYIASINHGLERLENLPISNRLLKEMHSILLRGGRGSKKLPGEFRKSQNWIGGTRPGNAAFVPPPPSEVDNCMSNLEKFLNNEFQNNSAGNISTLMKAAIAHVQFETIHPFLDGNGRIGRQLITLLLCSENVLKEPVLYLSLYFKKHRMYYYDLLNEVRVKGAWEKWYEFFLEGVIETCNQAISTAIKITELFEEDLKKISTLGRSEKNALLVYKYLQKKGICKIPTTSEELGLSQPTITSLLKRLESLGIVEEPAGKQRDRIFSYKSYINILTAED